MVQLNWTSQAKNELKDIADYISLDSKRYARLQIERIVRRTQVLKNHQFLGKIVPEVNREAIRELNEGNYRIIYEVVTKDRIDIITIHHSSRDLSKRNL